MTNVKSPEVIAIYASDINQGIGKENALAWKSSAEMRFFKETTENNVVIMGGKTFLSIGNPLKNRINIVVTKHSYRDEYAALIEKFEQGKAEEDKTMLMFFEGLEEAINYAKNHLKLNMKVISNYLFDNPDLKIYVIGGKSIYEQIAPYATHFIHSKFKKAFDCDVFFDHLHCEHFKIDNEQEKGSYEYAFVSSEDKGDFIVSEYVRFKVTLEQK